LKEEFIFDTHGIQRLLGASNQVSLKEEFIFDTHEEALEKYDEVIQNGESSKEEVTLYAPHPVHGLVEHLEPTPSRLRYITFFAGITGCLTGFGLTIYTSVYSLPLISGGKPLNSLPAFIVIAFELTILFGGVLSFLGFLLLSRLPNIYNILSPTDYGNKYAIVIEKNN